MVQKSIGSVLQERRTRLDWSLDVAENITTIKKLYVSALETENYGIFPNRFYVRAFLKQYATKLDLDVPSILAAFDAKTTVEVPDDFFEDTGNYRFVRPDQRVPERPDDAKERAELEAEEARTNRRHYAPITLLTLIALSILGSIIGFILLYKPSNTSILPQQYTLVTSSNSHSSSASSSTAPSFSISQTGSSLTVTVTASKTPVSLNFALNQGAATTSVSLTNSNIQALTLSADNPTATATINSNATTSTITYGLTATTSLQINGQLLQLTEAQKTATSIVLNIVYPQNSQSQSGSGSESAAY